MAQRAHPARRHREDRNPRPSPVMSHRFGLVTVAPVRTMDAAPIAPTVGPAALDRSTLVPEADVGAGRLERTGPLRQCLHYSTWHHDVQPSPVPGDPCVRLCTGCTYAATAGRMIRPLSDQAIVPGLRARRENVAGGRGNLDYCMAGKAIAVLPRRTDRKTGRTNLLAADARAPIGRRRAWRRLRWRSWLTHWCRRC